MWATLALATTLNLAPAQGGELDFKNIRATYGFLGPERKDAALLPGDVYVVSFDIDGLTVGKDDIIRYAMGVELFNAKKESQFKTEPRPMEVVNTLGGSRVPANANAQVGANTEPGKYTLVVTVQDRTSNKSKQLTQEFEVLKPAFGLARFALSSTNEPVPPIGAVGQTYFLNAWVVGATFDDKGVANISAEMTVTDEAGKPTMSQPVQAAQDRSEQARKLKVVPIGFMINLNRAGKFKLNVTVTDRGTGKKAEQSMDLTVLEIK
jgi:hypothetical protein